MCEALSLISGTIRATKLAQKAGMHALNEKAVDSIRGTTSGFNPGIILLGLTYMPLIRRHPEYYLPKTKTKTRFNSAHTHVDN